MDHIVSDPVCKIHWRRSHGKILEEGEARRVERLQKENPRGKLILEVESGWARKRTCQMLGLQYHEGRII